MRTAKAGEPREIEDLESPASPPSTVPLTGGLAGTVEDANLLAAAAAAAIGIAGAAAAAAGVQQGKTRANMRSRGSGHFSTDKGTYVVTYSWRSCGVFEFQFWMILGTYSQQPKYTFSYHSSCSRWRCPWSSGQPFRS